jgi:hypothetical protein
MVVDGQMAVDGIDQIRLVVISDHKFGTGLSKSVGTPLGVTARRHHRGIGVEAHGPTHGATGIGVSRTRDGAGVDHVHVGAGSERHQLVAAALESVLQCLHFALVELAPHILKGDAGGLSGRIRGGGSAGRRIECATSCINAWKRAL